jgi:hypothetical protein
MYKNTVVIVHFQPIEFYPPILNLLSIINSSDTSLKVVCITTNQTKFTENNQYDKVKIIRKNTKSKFRALRLLRYLYFYFYSFWIFIVNRPKKVLYFESISAAPCLLYKLLFNKSEIFVHFHEYTSPDEYRRGMFINRLNYILEKKYFKKYKWISHTNSKRMELFLTDVNGEFLTNTHVMPNYPTKKWINEARAFFLNRALNSYAKIKLFYVGALSFEDTYIREICDFVIRNEKKYFLSIYSVNYSQEVLEYLNEINNSSISFKGGIQYSEIPLNLSENNIGVIVYKGTVPNFIFNAPNKLFEYINGGLDVWFPTEMKGCYEYRTTKSPKIFEIDFNQIEKSLINYKLGEQMLPDKINSAEISTENLLNSLEILI